MHYPIHRFTAPDKLKELWSVSNPPKELYIQGSEQALSLLKALPERGLAVVGTRNLQARSGVLLRKWISELEGSGLIILSGLARGVDTIAHTAALDSGLPTIAILGAGLNLNYPKENQALRQRILQSHGLLVSEFAPHIPARGYHFLQRNRLISGWSKATWVVEAGHPSGALNTAWWAREQNKPCFAVPCYPGDPALSGNQTLLDRDHAIPFWGIHSLGSVWIEMATFTRKSKQKPRALGPALCHRTQQLVQYVSQLTRQKGGSLVQEALEWSLSSHWTPQEFFASLQLAIKSGQVLDQQGILVSSNHFIET